MGGALLFSASGSLELFRDALIEHWQNAGLEPVIRDQNQQSTIIEVTTETQIVRAFLVQVSAQRVDITVIQIAP